MAKILVPYDGSDSAQHALQHIIDFLAPYMPVSVHLLNVQEPPVMYSEFPAYQMMEQLMDGARAQGDRLIEEAAQRLAAAGVAHTAQVVIGNTAQAIADAAEEQAVDQIVMGTRGMGALSSLIVGSVATRVIHDARCPVTLVK